MPDLGDLIISAIRAKQAEQEIDAIQKENNRRRGITNYNPAPIEAFFNPDEPIGNMIFSGGANILRTRAITRLTDNALRKNIFVVLLHCGDTALETALRNYYSEQGIYIVNSNRPYYDPFLGKNGKEIGRLVFDSKTRDYHLSWSQGEKLNTMQKHKKLANKSIKRVLPQKKTITKET